MAAHSRDCEKADPGSLCDCDCAGARHAVGRTLRNRPAAGRVSPRAAAHARSQGRTPVIGDGRPDPGAPAPRARPGAMQVRTSKAPARVNPPLAAHIRAVKAGLPADRDAWTVSARTQNDPAVTDRLKAQQKAHQQEAADTSLAAAKRENAISLRLQVSQRLPQDEAERIAAADPEVIALYARRDAANDAASALFLPLARSRGGQYAKDPGTGMSMPDAALNAHLDSVLDVGHQVLAEARRQFAADPQAAAARKRLDRRAEMRVVDGQLRAARAKVNAGLPASVDGKPVATAKDVFYARGDMLQKYFDVTSSNYSDDDQAADRKLVARRERDTLLEVMAAVRPFGGDHHTQAVPGKADSMGDAGHGGTGARADWRERLDAAGQFFPTAWLDRSSTSTMTVVASDRAYYRNENTTLSMPAPGRDTTPYDGSFADSTEETNVHELGHRMEQQIPGLTHLEFALVRRRARRPDGTMQPIAPIAGYKDQTEVSQPDEWRNAYTGKTYEGVARDPATSSWEAFQVGLQDTLGRGSTVYGDDDGVLQAFTIGALLTLG